MWLQNGGFVSGGLLTYLYAGVEALGSGDVPVVWGNLEAGRSLNVALIQAARSCSGLVSEV